MMLPTFLSVSLLLLLSLQPAMSRSYLRRSLSDPEPLPEWADLLKTDFVCDDKYSQNHYFTYDIEVSIEGTCAKSRDVKSLSETMASVLPGLSKEVAGHSMRDEGVINATNVELKSLTCDSLVPTEKIWNTRRGLKAKSSGPPGQIKFSTDPPTNPPTDPPSDPRTTDPIDQPVDKPVMA